MSARAFDLASLVLPIAAEVAAALPGSQSLQGIEIDLDLPVRLTSGRSPRRGARLTFRFPDLFTARRGLPPGRLRLCITEVTP